MVKLAAEYGISGRGLAKLCSRYAIPVPGRGHWARKKAGYHDQPDELPTTPPPDSEGRIAGEPGREAEHPDVEAQIAYEAAHPILVAASLNQPHKFVALARETLRPRPPGHSGTLGNRHCPLQIHVSSKLLPRALRFFDALLKACEQRGFTVTTGNQPDSHVRINVHGEPLSVGLEEPNKRSDHVPTAKETADREAGRAWFIDRYDYTPTGRFVFAINE